MNSSSTKAITERHPSYSSCDKIMFDRGFCSSCIVSQHADKLDARDILFSLLLFSGRQGASGEKES